MTVQLEIPFDIGDKVWDALTGENNTVIGYKIENGRNHPESTNYMNAVTYYIDNSYLNGARFVHEIKKAEDYHDNKLVTI